MSAKKAENAEEEEEEVFGADASPPPSSPASPLPAFPTFCYTAHKAEPRPWKRSVRVRVRLNEEAEATDGGGAGGGCEGGAAAEKKKARISWCRRFNSEVLALQTLATACPGVAPTLLGTVNKVDSEGEDRGFVALEDVPGLDLTLFMGKHRQKKWVARLRLARSLCSALAAVHAAGVIHLDVKPENIIVLQKKTCGPCVEKIIDWECAVVLGKTTPPSTWGTMDFKPPEAEITPAVDCFALGVCLMEILLWLPEAASCSDATEHFTAKAETCLAKLPAGDLKHVLNAVKVVQGLLNENPAARLTAASAAWMLDVAIKEYCALGEDHGDTLTALFDKAFLSS